MRRALALAVAAVLCCAACSATAAQTPPSSPSSTQVSAPASTPAPTPARTTPHVAVPTTPAVPADVPRTGPNTRPGEKPPVMPVLATQHTTAGARAFAEFFIKTIDWGYATVDEHYIQQYSIAGCTGCTAFIHAIATARAENHRYIGGRITVMSASTSQKRPTAADTTILVGFNILSFEEVTRSDRFVRADIAHTGERFEVSLRWVRGRWLVRELAADA